MHVCMSGFVDVCVCLMSIYIYIYSWFTCIPMQQVCSILPPGSACQLFPEMYDNECY